VEDPSPQITLRRARREDAPAIGAVFDAAVRVGWAYLGEPVHSPLYPAAHWDDVVAEHTEPNALVVAEQPEHGITGFAAVHAYDCEVYLLFVDPAHGGRGIGRLLLDAAHDALRAAGCESCFLFTERRNARARAVYAAAGYEHDGSVRRSDFRGQALEEVRLVKRLARD
jgi:GNAT superfamily N-acetyltransferase